MTQMKKLSEAFRFICSAEFWRMSFCWTISLLLSYLQLVKIRILAPKSRSFSRRRHSPADSLRPVCVITGATSGLGKAAAFALSEEGFHIILAGRSTHLLSETMKEIKNQNKDAHLKAFVVDMSSFESISKFMSSLRLWLSDSDMNPSIQLLINNAGILATSSRLTAEGYDQMIATNYIGAFYLTKLMLPLLRNSPFPSRIVNVTSFTHRSVSGPRFDIDSVTGKFFLRSQQYPCAQIYQYSKLCLLLLTYELHRQLRLMDDSRHISVIAADPGAVKTNIMREVPSYLSFMACAVLQCIGLLKSPSNAVNSVLDAALAPPETSGLYFFGGNGWTIDSSTISHNSKLAMELWNTSSDLFKD